MKKYRLLVNCYLLILILVRRFMLNRVAGLLSQHFFQNSEGFKDRFETIINLMRREYGWTPKQVVLNDNVRGFV